MRTRLVDIIVGLFMLAGLVGLIALAFQVSGLTRIGDGDFYTITAGFDNIGGLKIRAPVSMAGVKIGQVTAIALNPKTFEAKVTMHIDNIFNAIPIDTSASIFTQGLLGSNYVSLAPGFMEDNLKNNSKIETTHSALILENLVGQLMYSLKNKGSDGDDDNGGAKNKDTKDKGAKKQSDQEQSEPKTI